MGPLSGWADAKSRSAKMPPGGSHYLQPSLLRLILAELSVGGFINRDPLMELRDRGESITAMLTIMCQNSKNIILLAYFTMGYGCFEDVKAFSRSWVGPEVD